MRYILFLTTFILQLSCLYAQDEKKSPDNFYVKIKIPSEWIEKVNQYGYSRNNKELLKEFESFIKPHKMVDPDAHQVDEDYGRVLNVTFANIDGESGDELICLIGWDVDSPYLTVFKQEQGIWYLIYIEEINTFYNSPSLSIANCFSRYKTFYLKRVYDHGSGVYIDGYTFYKLTNGKVYRCLELVNDAHIYGWGLYMNQSVKMKFEFRGDESDEVQVDYDYNFFPGAIKPGDCSWCTNDDISIIKGDGNVSYKWDNKSFTYKLDIPSYQNDVDDLTADKIKCFGDFGNDTLFVRAFKGQIKEVLKSGTLQQKSILKKYLALVRKNKIATTEKLKVTGKAGGATFYVLRRKNNILKH